jgi:hypothetical protein
MTVRTASALVAVPDELETMHRYCLPSSLRVSEGVVYEDCVAPEMFVLFFCHW